MHFASTLDSSQWQAGVQDMQKSFGDLAKSVEQEGGNIDAVISKIGQAAAGIGLSISAVAFVKNVATIRGSFQQLEQSFQTLLGNEEQADSLMKQLVKTAAVTPLDLQGVARGAKQLLAYGVEADKVNDKLVQLGDIAAGMGLSIDYITTLYGTTISKAHMDTMDLKQFMGQGIAIDQAIAEVMRVTKEEVPKLVTAGQVTSDIVEKAINQLASGDGKFAGMMANQAKTIAGQISNIQDALDMMFNDIGKNSEGAISDVLSAISYLVENYQEVGEKLAWLATGYATYKIASGAAAAMNRAEADALEKVINEYDNQASAEVKEVMAKQKVTQAEAEHIVQLRQELAMRMQSERATMQQAEIEETAAITKQSNLKKNSALLQAEIAELNARSTALLKSNETEAAAALQVEMHRKEQQLLNVQKEIEVATTDAQTATSKKLTAQRRLETLQTEADTASKVGATRASRLLAAAQNGLSKAMKATGLSALANPYVLAAAAITACAYGIYKLVTYETEEEKAVKKVNEAHKEASASVMKETAKLRSLCDALKAATPETEAYATAKENLLKFADQYDPKLRSELALINDTQKMYELAAQAVHKYYMTKARDAALENAEEEYAKSKINSQTKIYEQFEKIKKDVIDDAASKGIDASKTVNDIDKYFAEVQKAMNDGSLKVRYDIRYGFGWEELSGISEEAATFIKENTNAWTGGLGEIMTKANDALQKAESVRKAAIDRANAIFGNRR